MISILLRCSLWLLPILCTSTLLFGQKNPQQIETCKKKILSDKKIISVEFSEERQTPSLIVMDAKKESYSKTSASSLLSGFLELRPGIDALESFRITVLTNSLETVEFQQYFKGIKVEHGRYKALIKNDNIQFFNGAWFDVPSSLSIQPVLSEEQALNSAKVTIHATKYAWEEVQEMLQQTNDVKLRQSLQQELNEYLPKGELIIVKDFSHTGIANVRLAYKFNIYAAQPLSRQWIYIDAINGKFLLIDKIIKHINDPVPPNSVSTTVHTRYAGVQTIKVKQITGTPVTNPALDPILGTPIISSHPTTEVYIPGASTYVLIDDTKGNGIETYDLNGVGGLPVNVGAVYSQGKSFTDVDNNWDSTEHTRGLVYGGANEAENDDIAWDAHWGAGVVYDYWLAKHNRLSFDGNNGKIKSFIHYGPAYDNAFWNGTAMTYGDGSGVSPIGFKALTSLDVCGHEIGHGVCSYTSDLVYAGESGAMNEAFSDIWASCIEHFAMTRLGSTVPANKYRPFYIGEQIGADYDSPLRRMDNPKAQSNPDTYGGVNWTNPVCSPNLANDECGVHTNSGVLNHWFFLLTAGSLNGTRGPGTASYYFGDSDDELRDGANSANTGGSYTVNGLGFDASENIAFITETMITSSATYAETREVSIEVAKALSGDNCSSLVESVTNAWYAVGVGSAFVSPCTTTFGFIYQPGFALGEGTITSGCGSQKTFFVPVLLPTSSTATISTGGTAVSGKDYTLSTTTLTNSSASVNKQDTVAVYIKNDAVVEGSETIQLNVLVTNAGSNPVNTSYTITLTDDDVLPVIGVDSLVLLNETFTDANTGSPFNIPANWTETLEVPEIGNIDPTATTGFNHWGTISDKIGITGKTSVIALPEGTYNNLSQSQTIIRTTNKVDARGLNNIVIRFDYTVQGEVDATSPPGDLDPDNFPKFDYMAIVYSLDGTNWVELSQAPYKQFASLLQASGTYTAILPSGVNNQQFYIGFRWFNDANAGGPISVTVDNLTLKAAPTKIENDLNDNGQETLVSNEEVYYYSTQDRQIIGKVQATTSSCQTMSVVRTGNNNFTWYNDANGFHRVSDKIISITPAVGSNQSYTIALYYTEAQITSLEAFTGLARQNFYLYHSTAANYANANGTNTSRVLAIYTAIAGVGGIFTAAFNDEISGTYSIGAGLPQAPLPITCIDFRAVKGSNNVTLNWKVADERNNGGFAIERSADGVNYTQVGYVTADVLNNGSYTFIDNQVTGVPNAFYRLKQTDLTGGSKYLCTILRVRFDDHNAFVIGSIYPNPATSNEIFVNVTTSVKKNIRIEYVAMNGQLISWQQKELLPGTSRVALNFKATSQGTYLVRFKDEDNSIIDVQSVIRH